MGFNLMQQLLQQQQQQQSPLSQYAMAQIDPSRLPANFFQGDYNQTGSEGGVADGTYGPDKPYALTEGRQLGLDNNYKYAVYPDGRIEYAYQGNDTTYDPGSGSYTDPTTGQAVWGNPTNPTKTTSELAAGGWNPSSAQRDAHGVPLPGNIGNLAYSPWGSAPSPSNNLLDTVAPGLMFGALAGGVGALGMGAVGAGGGMMDMGGGLGLDAYGNVAGGSMGLSGGGASAAGTAGAMPDFSNLDFNNLDFGGMGETATGGQPYSPGGQNMIGSTGVETGGFNPATDPNTNFNQYGVDGGTTTDPMSPGVDPSMTNGTYTNGGNTDWLKTITQALSGAGGLSQLAGGAKAGSGGSAGANVLGGLAEMYSDNKYRQDLLNLTREAMNKADPFSAQRPQYQQMFQQYNTDPNFFKNDAVMQGMQDNALRQTTASNAARGYAGSGNILHDLTRTATETAAPYMLNRGNQIGQAAGAFQGTQGAGQVMGAMGPAYAAAGQHQVGGAVATGANLGNAVSQVGNAAQGIYNSAGDLGSWLKDQATTTFSDRRLKSNIVKVDRHPLGMAIYEYNIFGQRERGVMADEVLKVKPEAVSRHSSGYLMVNYGAL